MVGKTFLFAGHNVDILTTLCLLLFVGAMGKSAQFMLHTWLPDAMEGPTPVSALIHAATMVTAGVFLVCRASPLFELAPNALAFVTFIGATTAFFAASVGLFQNDIKRVIAYSTCSQLGYMFAAAGVSAYDGAMFHLFTHAFFKALLFLSAGCRDPFDASRAGHAQDGRACAKNSVHLGDDADRQSGAHRRRHSASGHRHGGLLFQGWHHQRHLYGGHAHRKLRLHADVGRGRHDLVLFLASVPDDISREISRPVACASRKSASRRGRAAHQPSSLSSARAR